MGKIDYLLYSEMLFLFVCLIVYYPHSKWRYLFAIPIGLISIILVMRYWTTFVLLSRIDLFSFLVSVGIICTLCTSPLGWTTFIKRLV